jgi:hypothetical protein
MVGIEYAQAMWGVRQPAGKDPDCGSDFTGTPAQRPDGATSDPPQKSAGTFVRKNP